jgi:hypothetical protein
MTEVTGRGGGTATPLLPREECDRFEQQLQHAVAEFVEEPRHAVEEADRTLEEIAARFTDAVTRRRRTLRMSWQSTDTPGAADDTEQLRLALRDYRELAELLLHDGGGNGATTAGAGEARAGEGMRSVTSDRMGSGISESMGTGMRPGPETGEPMGSGSPAGGFGEDQEQPDRRTPRESPGRGDIA